MKNKKGFLAEFREFIMRGNVLDMAVGVIIATSFGKITTSLVNDVMMPFLGGIIGDIDLTRLNWTMIPAVTEGEAVIKEAVVIGFGTLLATIIDFVLMAFFIFLMIKLFNKTREIAETKLLKKKEEEVVVEEVKAPTTEELLTEILAEIKKNNKE